MPTLEHKKSRIKGELVSELNNVSSEDGGNISVERYDDVVLATNGGSADNLQAADLLTQAMSELTQSLQEFRQGSTNITVHTADLQLGRFVAAAAANGGSTTLLQVQKLSLVYPEKVLFTQLLMPFATCTFYQFELTKYISTALMGL